MLVFVILFLKYSYYSLAVSWYMHIFAGAVAALYSSMRHNLYMVFNVGGRYAQKIIKIILHFFFQNKGYPFFKLNTFKLTFTIFIFVLSYQSREKERAELNEVTNPWTAYFGHMHTNVTWRNLMDKWTKHIYVAQTIPFYLTQNQIKNNANTTLSTKCIYLLR